MSQPLERLFVQAAGARACFEDVCGLFTADRREAIVMKKSKKATFFMICFVMVALAFIDGILGVFLPQIKPELGINDTQASVVFVANLLGFCVFTSIGGRLCDKIGSRKSFFLLLGILLLFCLAMLRAHTYARLILLSFALYCALAALTVTVNSFIPSLFTASQAFFMSFFHLVNYGGIALSKTTAGLLIRHNVNWRFIYLIIAAILIICLGLWHFSFFPAPVVPDTEKKPEGPLPHKHIFSTAFFLYAAAVGGYLSSVTAMHNWFVNYAVISFHMDIAGASSVFSLFFIFSALGSVLLARFIKRVGEFKIVFLLSFAAFFLFLLGLLWRQTGLYLIALCGFFLSVTYPTTLVNIHTSFPLRPCFMLGLIVTAGSAINLISTFVLGIANDVFGAHASFYLVPLGLLVFSVSSFFIYLRQNTLLSKN